jgi:hypothetical protein
MHSSSSILSNKKGSEAYHNFINSLSSSVTKTEYSKWFGYYIQYLNKQRDDEDYDMLLQESPKLIQSRIIDTRQHQLLLMTRSCRTSHTTWHFLYELHCSCCGSRLAFAFQLQNLHLMQSPPILALPCFPD